MEPEGFEFGDIRVDLRLQTVTRAGGPVALEPKTFDVLRYLLVNRDRLVTKDELLDSVWKDTFVTPNVLTRAVAQLRKALGDDAQEPRYIETVAKRGYRFLAEVRDFAPTTTVPLAVQAAAPRFPRWGIAAAVVLLAALAWLGFSRTGVDEPAPALSLSRITVSGDVIDAAISPDGRYVVYVRSAGGLQSLWVRQVAAANPVQLIPPASVGYWGVAFSPDSASIYFATKGAAPDANAAGTLYTIPVLPGPPPMPVLTGIDSTITFAPDGRRFAFYRVDPGTPGTSSLIVADRNGGGEQVLASRTVPKRFAPRFFTAPAWSPDGAQIAVAVQDESTRTTDLLLIAVEGGAEQVVRSGLAGASFLHWVPDGSGILFTGSPGTEWATAGAQIWLQDLDGGTPRRVTTDAVEYRNVSVASDGDTLIAIGTDHQATLWRVTPREESGAARIPSMRGDGLGGTAWIGDRLYFTGFETGQAQIWSMAADGSDRRQITADGWTAWPCASPDGRQLFAIGARGGDVAILRMDPDGRNARRLASVQYGSALTISSDGQWLYYTVESGSEESTWRLSVNGGAPQLVVRGLGSASLSPDGRRLAGLWRRSAQEPYSLAVFDADSGAQQLDFPGFYSTGLGKAVQWSPDGESLLLTTSERMNIWRQPLAGGPLEKVTSFVDAAIFTVAPDADGKGLILSRGPSIRDAFLINGLR